MDEEQTQGVSSQTEQVESVDVAPASEQESTSQEVTETSDRPNEVSEADSDTVDSLPDEQSAQAKAFQSFRKENSDLKRELESIKQAIGEKQQRESAFEQLKPAGSSIDETVEQKLDEIRAKEKYPQLDISSNKYDLAFEEEVAARYFFDLYRGKNPSLVKISDDIAKGRGLAAPDVKRVQQEAIKQVKEQLTVKEQAALAPTGKAPQPAIANAQRREELRTRARGGDDWALAELIRSS